jgi:predicted nucleic acid-binding protein
LRKPEWREEIKRRLAEHRGKELVRPPISDAEKARLLRLLARLRLINPDNQIAAAYSDLLSRYGYLRVHLADALIAASAWVKNLPLVTTNARHFQQIREIGLISERLPSQALNSSLQRIGSPPILRR